MHRRLIRTAGPFAVLLSACAGHAATPAPASEGAFRRFRPDVAPFDSGGECVTQPRPRDDARAVYSAYFPGRGDARSVVTLVFDANGRLRQSTEARGVLTVIGLGPAPRARAIDSAFAAVRDTLRTTFISLDFRTDRASAENRGGGRPDRRVVGELSEAEAAPSLDRPRERVRRAMAVCGVTEDGARR